MKSEFQWHEIYCYVAKDHCIIFTFGHTRSNVNNNKTHSHIHTDTDIYEIYICVGMIGEFYTHRLESCV